jgi:hypothetical protein
MSKNLGRAAQDKTLKTGRNRGIEGIAGNFTEKR